MAPSCGVMPPSGVLHARHGAITGAAGLTAALAGLVADVAPGKSYSAKRVAVGTALPSAERTSTSCSSCSCSWAAVIRSA